MFKITPGKQKHRTILQTTLNYYTRNEKLLFKDKKEKRNMFLNPKIIKELSEIPSKKEQREKRFNLSATLDLGSRSVPRTKPILHSIGRYEQQEMKKMAKYAFVLFVIHKIYKVKPPLTNRIMEMMMIILSKV